MMAKTHAPLSASIGGAFAFAYMQWETMSEAWSSSVGSFVNRASDTMNAATSAMTWSQIAICFIVVMSIGGYALAPDFDEPGATIVKKTGPVGALLSPVVRAWPAGIVRGRTQCSRFSDLGCWVGTARRTSWLGCFLPLLVVT